MVQVRPSSNARFNVLLTEDRPHSDEHWSRQLSRLLEPQGVAAYVANTGHEALALTRQMAFHAAVVDVATPVGQVQTGATATPGTSSAEGVRGGLWLLEVIRHMPNMPPVVLLGSPPTSRAQGQQLLREALKLGAFSVMRKPVDVERVLAVIRKLVDRQYRGNWPLPTTLDRAGSDDALPPTPAT